MKVIRAGLIAAAATLGCMGCGSGEPKAEIVEAVPASGTLTYKGAPLENCVVTFHPVDGRRPASGQTDASGKFTLGTNDAGDGAPPGSHKVTVTQEVPAAIGEPGKEDFSKPPPRPKNPIPQKYATTETSGLTADVPAGGTSDLKIDLH